MPWASLNAMTDYPIVFQVLTWVAVAFILALELRPFKQ